MHTPSYKRAAHASEGAVRIGFGPLAIIGPLLQHAVDFVSATLQCVFQREQVIQTFLQTEYDSIGMRQGSDHRVDEAMQQTVLRLVDEPRDLVLYVGDLFLEHRALDLEFLFASGGEIARLFAEPFHLDLQKFAKIDSRVGCGQAFHP